MLKLLGLLLFFISFELSAKTLPATDFQVTHNFIKQMVEKHQFNERQLLLIFSQIKLTVADKPKFKKTKKKPPRKPMTWDKYRALSITDKRIDAGARFYRNNLTTLKRAEDNYHVPGEIIVAILGIESNYGNKQGTHPTLQTLAKRAFGNYRRRNFYRKEMENFLILVRANSIPPLSVSGSYAGAMGYPQFIASSIKHFAVDFNQDGKIDLFSDPIDAIGSIGNYLDKHQWHDYGAIVTPIRLEQSQLKYAKFSTNKPKKNAAYWRQKGLNIDPSIPAKTKLAFIRLPQKDDSSIKTWLTFWNFYVLTRYNHDNRYAMVVYQLSEKIKHKFNQQNL